MEISELSVGTIRALGIDMINRANSGHPGMVLGSAPVLYQLFTKELVVDPCHSDWFNRDRFVLASGHASALLYSLLHLSGFKVTLEDLKQFRQLGSCTPGHPEIHVTDGVDASSGPLGQGIPTAVGMAMAEQFLASRYNKKDFDIVDHYTYVLCGDGDMQEGVTYEGASLAGHYSLGKLIVIYDSNKVTLDGDLDLSFSENVRKRFEAMNWQVIEVSDGNHLEDLSKAITKAKKNCYKPSLIIMQTQIGYGSKNAGTSKVHGAPLGDEDGLFAKRIYGVSEESFYVPEEVYDHFKKTIIRRGKSRYNKWNKLFKAYREAYPEAARELENGIYRDYKLPFDQLAKNYTSSTKAATRNISHEVINFIAKKVPTFMSGSADLSSSTKSNIDHEGNFSPEHYHLRNICFGIREFSMVCVLNGMTLHTGLMVSGSGFLVFADYFKSALRMAALMNLPIILTLTHDSIAVGEDGPTHQPIEQLQMMRSIPNVCVIRPADANESVGAWKFAVESKEGPTALIFTRQDVENSESTDYQKVQYGAYIVGKEINRLDAIIIASGSEVPLALKAKKQLLQEGIDVRVVSMPSMELFDAQTQDYRDTILPPTMRKRLSVEMSTSFGWHKYVGLDGRVMSIECFGESGPATQVIEHFGFNVENIVQNIKEML